MPFAGGQVQRGLAVGVLGIHVRLAGEQHLGHLKVRIIVMWSGVSSRRPRALTCAPPASSRRAMSGGLPFQRRQVQRGAADPRFAPPPASGPPEAAP